MGFWDFIAPDFTGFRAALEPYVPDHVQAGPLSLSRESLIDLAWLAPASAAGLAGRLFYQAGNVQGSDQSTSLSLLQAQLDNLARGGVQPLGNASSGTDLTEGVNVTQIVLANTYEATVRMVSGGRAVDNVFHFTGTGSGQEQACCTALQTSWKGSGKPFAYMDNKVSLVSFQVVDLSTINGGIYTIADTTAGSKTAASIATRAACVLVQYNGQTRNRSSRGRTYFGPLYEAEVDIDGATLTGSAQTLFAGYFTTFRAGMTTAGFTQCVLSRKLVASFAVTFQRIQPTIATQRRRLRA